MFGNDNNNGTYLNPGYMPNPGASNSGRVPGVPILNQDINMPFPAQQMANALLNYGSSILPYWASMSFDFTTAATSVAKSVTIDASYYFFIYGVSPFLYTGSTDYGTTITSIQINTLTNFVQQPLPVVMFSQYSAAPPPFFLVVPATSSLTVEVLNGSTATNHVRLTFWGQRVPSKIANSILEQYGMSPLG